MHCLKQEYLRFIRLYLLSFEVLNYYMDLTFFNHMIHFHNFEYFSLTLIFLFFQKESDGN